MAISEHVMSLPSLCVADGLKCCVFILSQESTKKILFSAELKLNQTRGKKCTLSLLNNKLNYVKQNV